MTPRFSTRHLAANLGCPDEATPFHLPTVPDHELWLEIGAFPGCLPLPWFTTSLLEQLRGRSQLRSCAPQVEAWLEGLAPRDLFEVKVFLFSPSLSLSLPFSRLSLKEVKVRSVPFGLSRFGARSRGGVRVAPSSNQQREFSPHCLSQVLGAAPFTRDVIRLSQFI